MKRNRKTIATILCIIMLFLCASPSFAFNKSESNYDILLNKGYPTEYLNSLNEDFMGKMVEQIGDNCVLDIDFQTATLTENSSVARGNIDPTDMDLQIVSSPIYQINNKKINGVMVTITWEWAAYKPLYRGEDLVTANWTYSSFRYDPDTFFAQDYYKSNENDEWTVLNEYTEVAESNDGGLGNFTDLEEFKKYVGGGILFFLEPKFDMYRGNDRGETINVNYVHAPVPLTGLGIDVLDIGISASWLLPCDSRGKACEVKYSLQPPTA